MAVLNVTVQIHFRVDKSTHLVKTGYFNGTCDAYQINWMENREHENQNSIFYNCIFRRWDKLNWHFGAIFFYFSGWLMKCIIEKLKVGRFFFQSLPREHWGRRAGSERPPQLTSHCPAHRHTSGVCVPSMHFSQRWGMVQVLVCSSVPYLPGS